MSNAPNLKILDFLKSHYQMTVSVVLNGESWSANCFYVFDENDISLVFLSDKETKHAQGFLNNSLVSGTIADLTENISEIKGVQFLGEVSLIKKNELKSFKQKFIFRFGLVKLLNIEFWKIKLTYVKMTDNKLVFSSKTHWKRDV